MFACTVEKLSCFDRWEEIKMFGFQKFSVHIDF